MRNFLPTRSISSLLIRLFSLASNLSALGLSTLFAFGTTLLSIDSLGSESFGGYVFIMSISGLLLDIIGASLASYLVRYHSSPQQDYDPLVITCASCTLIILTASLSGLSVSLLFHYSVSTLSIFLATGSRTLYAINRTFIGYIRTRNLSFISDYIEYATSSISFFLLVFFLSRSGHLHSQLDLLWASLIATSCTLLITTCLLLPYLFQHYSSYTLCNALSRFNLRSVPHLISVIRPLCLSNSFALLSFTLPTLVIGLVSIDSSIISSINVSRQLRTAGMYPLYAYSTLTDKYLPKMKLYTSSRKPLIRVPELIYSSIPSISLFLLLFVLWDRAGTNISAINNLYTLLTDPQLILTMLISLFAGVSWSYRRRLFFIRLDRFILLSEAFRVASLSVMLLILIYFHILSTDTVLVVETISALFLLSFLFIYSRTSVSTITHN